MGKSIDGIFNKSFNNVNKLISIFTGSDKILFDFVLSSGIGLDVKIGIGSYYFFNYVKTNVKSFTYNIATGLKKVKRNLHFDTSSIDIDSPDIDSPDIDLPDIDSSGLPSVNISDDLDDFKTLTTIIQIVVTCIIIMIIILVISKSNLIA